MPTIADHTSETHGLSRVTSSKITVLYSPTPKAPTSLPVLNKWDVVDVCDAKQLVSDAKVGQKWGVSKWKGRSLEFSTRGHEGAPQLGRAKCLSRQRRNEFPGLSRQPTTFDFSTRSNAIPGEKGRGTHNHT